MAIELYKHNKKAYSNVLEHFETTNRTCVVHATGTGKSFISLKWLEDNKDKKCLFLAPTHAIIDQFKTHIEDNGLSLSDFPNLEFELYTNVNNRIADNKYDCIVMDEFHRCGAKEWSKGINKLLDNNEDAKVLGLSATPIRYLDDNRNMADEIFNGNIASEISIAEAIAMGILQAPTYITSIYSFDNEIDKIQNQIDKYKNKEEKKELQKKLDEAKNMLEKSRGLSEVFEKYIKNDKGKYIVFCKDKPHMELMEEKSNEWFKNINKIKVNDVYYEKGRELNKYAIDSFENNERDELKLLFSIEMLNEGVHVKSIDGVIMFRPTVSPIIYFQQLGRALSVGHNEHPIVFDVVNNYECLDQIHKLIIESHNNHFLLRKFLTNHGFYISHESTIYDNGKYYINIVFLRGNKKYSSKELKYGPLLIKGNKDYYEYLYNKNKQIYENIPRYKIIEKIKLLKDIKYFKRLKK